MQAERQEKTEQQFQCCFPSIMETSLADLVVSVVATNGMTGLYQCWDDKNIQISGGTGRMK